MFFGFEDEDEADDGDEEGEGGAGAAADEAWGSFFAGDAAAAGGEEDEGDDDDDAAEEYAEDADDESGFGDHVGLRMKMCYWVEDTGRFGGVEENPWAVDFHIFLGSSCGHIKDVGRIGSPSNGECRG